MRNVAREDYADALHTLRAMFRTVKHTAHETWRPRLFERLLIQRKQDIGQDIGQALVMPCLRRGSESESRRIRRPLLA